MKIRKHLAVRNLGTDIKSIQMDGGAVFALKNWASMGHPERLQVFRKIAMQRGRDPRIANLAIRILKNNKVQPRAFEKQASALLKWVQNNIYFANEPGERLQDPIRTLKVRYGDCDDASMLLAALFESINLPWRYVLSGRIKTPDGKFQKIRYIEGTDPSIFDSKDVKWVHIYLVVGTPPFQPDTWYFAEPTIKGVPLGWDVVSGDKAYLPEMLAQPRRKGSVSLFNPGPAPAGFKPVKAPRKSKRSPAYDIAYGDSSSSAFAAIAGGITAADMIEDDRASAAKNEPVDWSKLLTAVVSGVAISVSTSVILDWWNGKGVWTAPVPARVSDTVGTLAATSVFAAPPPVGSENS